MASPIQIPKSPTQVSPVPKIFKSLPKTNDHSSASPPRGTLNLLHSTSITNIKLSLADISEASQTSEASKKLTAFRSWKARQKKKVADVDSLFGSPLNKLKTVFMLLYSVLFGGIKAIIVFIFRAFKEIFDLMFEYVFSLVSKIMPLYPDKWFQLCSWVSKKNILRKNSNSVAQISKRTWTRTALWLKKPLTLVLDLDETLIHSSKVRPLEGSYETMMIVNRDGICQTIYLRKRPYLNEFLEKVAKEFNIVIFTASRMEYADTIIDFIDRDYSISRRFYRDSCSRTPNGWVKDLSKIEPDLRRVILLDNCRAASTLQPENHLLIKSWFYDEADKSLLHYTDFLNDCAKKWKSDDIKTKDLRKYLKDFS